MTSPLDTLTVCMEGVDLFCEKLEITYPEGGGVEIHNLAPGDTVIGRRWDSTRDWKIGTVSRGLWSNTLEHGWMYCDESSFYPFNVGDCLKVLKIDDLEVGPSEAPA